MEKNQKNDSKGADAKTDHALSKSSSGSNSKKASSASKQSVSKK